MREKINSIQLLRFVFALIIIFFHMQQYVLIRGLFTHGNIAVSFFFVVSGWFMAKHVDKKEEQNMGESTFLYALHKDSKFYIPYLICWIGSYIYFNMVEQNTSVIWVDNFLRALPELIMIRMIGFTNPSYVSQGWYLSAMIITIFFVYPWLLKYKYTYIYAIAPTVSVVVFGFINYQTGRLGGVEQQFYLFTKGCLWAFAAINLGVFMYGLGNLIMRNAYTDFGIIVLKSIKWLLFIFIIGYAVGPFGVSAWDYMFTFFIGVYIMLEIIMPVKLPEKINPLFNWLGEFSLYIYLVHVTVLDWWHRYLMSHQIYSLYIRYIGFLVLTCTVGIIVLCMTKIIRRGISRLKKIIIVEM